MTRLRRSLVAFVTLPFLVGCFGVTQTAVPSSLPERQALELRGVVVVDPDGRDEEVLRFSELHDVGWTPSALSFVADVEGQQGTVTRLVPITELRGVLVRQLDAGRTSAVIGGVLVGAIAAFAVLVTGDRNAYNPG